MGHPVRNIDAYIKFSGAMIDKGGSQVLSKGSATIEDGIISVAYWTTCYQCEIVPEAK
jgi:hypothetical protein